MPNLFQCEFSMNWQTPITIRSVRLWSADPSQPRRASWLELFFDLIFVAAVAQVGVPLGEDYTLHGLVRYALMFLLIWWAWLGHTMYSTRFDADDVVQRLLTLLQIFAAAAMAANAKSAFDSRDSAGFGAAYAVLRAVLVVQYLRARRLKETRRLTTLYSVGFGVASLLWGVAAIIPAPMRFWLWGAALLIDMGTPWLAVQYTHKCPLDAEHLPERFGLSPSFCSVSPWLLSCTAWRARRCGVRQPQSRLLPALVWRLDIGGGTSMGRTALPSVTSHQTAKHSCSKSGATRTSRSTCVSQSSVWESST